MLYKKFEDYIEEIFYLIIVFGLILMQPDKRTEQIVFRNSSNQIIFKRGIPANVKSLYLQALQFCGERGIRTPGPVTVNGFQDRRIRPLCHLSGAKIHFEILSLQKKYFNVKNLIKDNRIVCCLFHALFIL